MSNDCLIFDVTLATILSDILMDGSYVIFLYGTMVHWIYSLLPWSYNFTKSSPPTRAVFECVGDNYCRSKL